jgi:hypothetical protein
VFDKGKCLDISWEAKPAPWKKIPELPFHKSRTIAMTSAPFDMFLTLNKGEISM